MGKSVSQSLVSKHANKYSMGVYKHGSRQRVQNIAGAITNKTQSLFSG